MASVSVDPRVSEGKYSEEVARLAKQRALLEARGIFLLAASKYPHVDVLFVPRRTLQLGMQTPHSGRILLPQGTMMIAAAEVDSLSARAFKGRFDLSDYDLRAPGLEFLDPWNDKPLDYATMLRAQEYEKQRGAHVVLIENHPTTHKPFLCIRGIREYHEHPQHSGDDWLLYRSEMSLFSIILSVWRVTVDLIHPILLPQPGGFHVQWNVEEKM